MNTVIAALIALIADQLLKLWTTRNLVEAIGEKKLIPGLVHLTNIHNQGAAFGILGGARWLFVILFIIFTVVVAYVILNGIVSDKIGKTALIMATVGAFGNFIDRLLKGYVVDMFQLEFMKFPVFNIADILITVGAIVFCVTILLEMKNEKAAKAAGGPGAQTGPRNPRQAAPQRQAGAEGEAPAQKKEGLPFALPSIPGLKKRTKIELPPRQPRPAPQRPVRQAPPPLENDPFADWDSPAQGYEQGYEAEGGELYEVSAPTPVKAAPVYTQADVAPRRRSAPAYEEATPVHTEAPARAPRPAPVYTEESIYDAEAPAMRQTPVRQQPPVQVKRPAPAPAPAPAQQEYVPQHAAPAQAAPAPAPKPRPVQEPVISSDDFNLDDILNEFRDIL
ncbi:MAG: signal peptidase II [Oscillospiraceae bacterium]|nr:signal peptidase II [Oscillospiraceae bacterium]